MYGVTIYKSTSLSPAPVKGLPGPLAAFLCLLLLLVGLHRRRYLLRAKDLLDPLIVGKEKPQAPALQGLAVLNASYFTPTPPWRGACW